MATKKSKHRGSGASGHKGMPPRGAGKKKAAPPKSKMGKRTEMSHEDRSKAMAEMMGDTEF